MKNLFSCIILFVILTVITGVIYPLGVTGVSGVLFPEKAEGSLIRINGEIAGSSLIGQNFADPAYFWPRPSASDHQAVPSGASNLGPTSDKLKQAVDGRRKKLAPYFSSAIPADLLLASGSGLDPQISPEAGLQQVDHIAKVRGLSGPEKDRLIGLVKENLEGPQVGIFGQARLNVLRLNLMVDLMFGPVKGGNR